MRLPIAIASVVILVSLLARPLPRGLRLGGTFIGAVISEDGIVVGSDSRSTFIDDNGRSLGYLDGIQKIYVGSSAAVAVSGLTSVEGDLFNSFVDKNSFLLLRSVDEILFGLSAWLPFKNSTGVLLLSGGWKDGNATVCVRSVVQPQACRTSGYITNKPSVSLRDWLSAQHNPFKADAAAAALKQAIEASAASDVTVGGPISLVQLRANAQPTWLENKPTDHGWKTLCDIVRDYRAGRVRIVVTSTQAELDRNLAATCPR